LRCKLDAFNQTYASSKSLKQLPETIFHDSAVLIEKQKVGNRRWEKVKQFGSSRTLDAWIGKVCGSKPLIVKEFFIRGVADTCISLYFFQLILVRLTLELKSFGKSINFN
jgi:hypothetical protein